GAFQTRSPKRLRRGGHKGGGVENPTTFLAGRQRKKNSHTHAQRGFASRLGIFLTLPCPLRTLPRGKLQANQHTAALWSNAAVRRAFMVCRSHSDSVPFKPKRRRPLTVAGS